MELSQANKQALLTVAGASIDRGLKEDRALEPSLDDFDGPLVEPGACFVTINLDGELRGCIGTLEARLPLIVDAAENAYNAAFRDPRFSPLTASERPELDIHLSVLTPPQPLAVSGADDLLAKLKPGVDGLVLREGMKKATFLPSVWESLPDAERFLGELMRKAGLPPDHWSDQLEFKTYRVIEVP